MALSQHHSIRCAANVLGWNIDDRSVRATVIVVAWNDGMRTESSSSSVSQKRLTFHRARVHGADEVTRRLVAEDELLRNYVHRTREEVRRKEDDTVTMKSISSCLVDASSRETAKLLTVLISTSATQSNPSTLLLETTMASFRYAPLLWHCRRIIVCDGYRSGERTAYRRGILDRDAAVAYEEYVDRLTMLAESGVRPVGGSKVLALPDRRGFGHALKAALELVSTPYVMVVQHDRVFSRPLDVAAMLRWIGREPRIKYLHFPTFVSSKYLREFRQRNLQGTNKWVESIRADVEDAAIPFCRQARDKTNDRSACGGGRALPLFHWYDSTHIVPTSHYKYFVFGRDELNRTRVKFGSFPEDKLGQQARNAVKIGGMSAHAAYGTYVYDLCLGDDADDDDDVVIEHLDGRAFVSISRRNELDVAHGGVMSKKVVQIARGLRHVMTLRGDDVRRLQERG